MSRARTLADLVADGSVGVSDITGLTAYIDSEVSDVTWSSRPSWSARPRWS